MNANTALMWLIALPVCAAPAIYLTGRYQFRRRAGTGFAYTLALLTFLAEVVFLWITARSLIELTPPALEMGSIRLVFDGISLVISGATLLLGLVVVIFSGPYIRKTSGEEKFYALLVGMSASIMGLSVTRDLFNLWVWFECMTLTSFLLVAYYQQLPPALEAGFKYLVQSVVGSVLILLGIVVVFAETGSLALDKIVLTGANPSPMLAAAGALFLVGFGVKAALVPLHTWLPDAHSQAPSGISAMLSGVVIEAGLVALLRVLLPTSGNGLLLLIFGACNMLLGNLMALRQTQVKRLLAYSSVSHMGYMLLGIGITLISRQPEGAAGSLFHIINHSVMKGLAFLSAGSFLYTLHIARNNHEPLTLDDLCGSARRYPLAAFSLSIAVLALGGLPPFSGFMSKWQIFVAGFQTYNIGIILLVIFAGLNSVLSLAYYAPIVNRIYRRQSSVAVQQGSAFPGAMVLPLILLCTAVILLGAWPALISDIVYPAANSLLSAVNP